MEASYHINTEETFPRGGGEEEEFFYLFSNSNEALALYYLPSSRSYYVLGNEPGTAVLGHVPESSRHLRTQKPLEITHNQPRFSSLSPVRLGGSSLMVLTYNLLVFLSDFPDMMQSIEP